jgi:hypothetical protein
VSRWDFGDGTVISNQLPGVSHSWTAPGDYVAALWAYNNSYPNGVSATVVIHVLENPVHCVSQNSTNPVAPYFSWNTAATNIQDAVDAAYVDGTVLVTNGVYSNGGRAVIGLEGSAMNRVMVTKQIAIRSVNGPAVTVIQGDTGSGAVRCVYLISNTMLAGFTLTNGQTAASGYVNDKQVQSGGGVFCESSSVVVSNCVLVGNSAYIQGGGAYSGTLKNCFFVGNSVVAGEGGGATATLENCILVGNSAYDGGGAAWSTLNNCVLISNTAAYDGGGASGSTLNNCIAYYNAAPSGSNYDIAFGPCTLNYCNTTPLPANGTGNITNEPLFVNLAGGDYHLQSNSPCINSGNNADVTTTTDFDGNPRIVGGTVDIGAYEYQTPTSIISYAWLQQYGFPTDGSADFIDTDGDGMNNWQEWMAGTDPTNPLSVLKMLAPASTNNPSGLAVTWQSVTNRTYYLQRSGDLSAQPAFSTIQSNIVGQANMTTYTDTNAVGAGPYFYRVGVQ